MFGSWQTHARRCCIHKSFPTPLGKQITPPVQFFLTYPSFTLRATEEQHGEDAKCFPSPLLPNSVVCPCSFIVGFQNSAVCLPEPASHVMIEEIPSSITAQHSSGNVSGNAVVCVDPQSHEQLREGSVPLAWERACKPTEPPGQKLLPRTLTATAMVRIRSCARALMWAPHRGRGNPWRKIHSARSSRHLMSYDLISMCCRSCQPQGMCCRRGPHQKHVEC